MSDDAYYKTLKLEWSVVETAVSRRRRERILSPLDAPGSDEALNELCKAEAEACNRLIKARDAKHDPAVS